MHYNPSVYFDPLLVADNFLANPYPLLHQLREREPVYWSDSVGGWLLTRYDDIVVTMKDAAHFSNENRLGQAVAYLPPERRAKYKPFEDHYKTKGLLHSDPPDHTRMRSLITKEFTPKVVEDIKPRIRKAVNDLLDTGSAQGQMDLVPDLAAALPVNIFGEILGVPTEDRHLFKTWTDGILGFQGSNKPSEADLTLAQQCLIDLRAYLMEMVIERRRQPRVDLMSKLVAVEASGQRLTEAELLNTGVTLFTAGHETTVAFISNSIYTLLSHPEQLNLLRQNHDLLGSALEECLRFESPVSRQTRLMKADVEMDGKLIRKGEIVIQMLNAANRDPKYFPQPDNFDIRREPNRHMAFGQGIHFCAGATLARAEATIAVETVLKRFPNLELLEQTPQWVTEKRNSRVLRSLRVRL